MPGKDECNKIRYDFAEEWKEKGNALFKVLEYESAASHYAMVSVG